MPRNPSAIVPSEATNRKLLDYIFTLTERARGWWTTPPDGAATSRTAELTEYRLRMEGRRSVAELYHDAKSAPFEGASNVGVDVEAIFSEFLIPLLLANGPDLEPMLQATRRGTTSIQSDLTTFHDQYHRFVVPNKRELLETSCRELLTVGSMFHKWSYRRLWRQTNVNLPVWVNPISGTPLMQLDEKSGRPLPQPADPNTPKEQWPRDPVLGTPLKIASLKAINQTLVREGPELSVVPVERITFPDRETRLDPDQWEWVAEDFEVDCYWLLGKEGDPMHGQLTLKPLWRSLGIDPDSLARDPLKVALQTKPVKLRAWHGKYPVAADGSPVEVVALVATEARLLLGWQPSPFPRRPYFNRQVWASGSSPIGKGIPETVYGMRAAMDALLNQDLDAGNLYNNPPLLVSDLAVGEDEELEATGPGAVWYVRDINGMKFLPTAMNRRDPVALLDWLIVNTMRLWGVTDLSLNSPTNRLSSTPQTLGGTQLVLNQGNIKFGHLTKRLTAVDTLEYQYVHDAFRTMLAHPLDVTVNGEPTPLDPAKREAYFAESVRVTAVGNGITTNPILRQQALTQVLTMGAQMQNPFLIGDLEVYKDLTDQWVTATGVDVTLKDPQALQQQQLFLQIMQTPMGQQVLPKIMQEIAVATVAQGGSPGAPPTNGAPTNGHAQPVPTR